MGNRVIVIGIDGGTWKIIDPLLKEGKLPNIENIIQKGVRSSLQTTIPSQTVPAWPTCITGVNPGKQGVYHFLADSHKDYDEGRTLNINDLKVKTIFDYLTENNRVSLSIFVPFTYPPPEINGAIVTPVRILKDLGKAELKTFPPELYKEIQKVLEVNLGTLAEQKAKIERLKDEFKYVNKVLVLERMKNLYLFTIKKIKEGTLHLMNKYNWDFLMVVFTPVDVLQHRFWRFMDKTHPTYEPTLAKKFGKAISDGYIQVDQAIGDILRQAGDNITLFIVSDHGIAPVSKWFFINNFLKNIGLLRVKGISPFRLKIKTYPLQKILNRSRMKFLAEMLPQRIKKLKIPLFRYGKVAISEMIEWNNTYAYAMSFGININLKGREPNGVVSPSDYNSLIEKIKVHLYQLEDPDTRRKIISRVFTKEELYSGPYMQSAPDIQFLLSEPDYMFSKSLDDTALFKNMNHEYAISAHHINSEECVNNAIFMACGKYIKPTSIGSSPRIMDIVPTVLHVMGIPVPESLDGKIMTDILDKEFLIMNQINYQKANIFKERDAVFIGEEEEQKTKEHLRNLGYIE
jgi:predicted AlkP superfamily phosphohydrolase/phosphomutase